MEKKVLTKEEKEFIKLSETLVPKVQKWRSEEKDAKFTTSEYIQCIKEQNIRLRIELGKYMQDTQNIVDAAIKERISEKDKYLHRIERECDNKVANKELIITGLRQELANLRSERGTGRTGAGFFSFLKGMFHSNK